MSVRAWLAERPWIWIVVVFLAVVAVNVALLMVAEQNPPLPA